MECFGVVKSVLDELYTQIPGSEDQRDAAITERLDYLSNCYKELSTCTNPIDYSDPVTRFAYIYRYVTSHADVVCQLIGDHSALSSLFDDGQWVDVTCIGGGPGSDFVGILKHMMQNANRCTLKCYLYDGEQAWNDSWSDVDKKLSGCDFRISTSFQAFDVTSPTTWQPHRKYLQADLFTMIYFMSEVYQRKQQAEPFFDNLVSSAKQGALFLFVDNNASQFYGWFDELVQRHSLKVIASSSGRVKLGWDEDKSHLGLYLDKFGYPKISADIAYRVVRKP